MVPVLLLAAYLTLWPVPVEPVAWQAPTAPGYHGAHAVNNKLAGLRHIDLYGDADPESIVQGPDGLLYASVDSPAHGGRIVRFAADGSGAPQLYATTGGRPLGLAFDADGTLIVADAFKGLVAIRDGQPVVLAPAHFANAVAVAASGKIYFTDSSARFTPAASGTTLEAAMLDALEQSATGRVLAFDPATAKVRVVATGLSFANGLVLASDERTLLVAESARYRVWQIAVDADAVDVGAPAGQWQAAVATDSPPAMRAAASLPARTATGQPQARVVLDNLPGYPDNLTRGADGRIWLGLGGQRNELDAIAQRPFLRRMVLRVPRALWQTPPPYGHVMAFTEDGAIVADLQDPSGKSPLTTGATEAGGRLYIHSIGGNRLGWLPLPVTSVTSVTSATLQPATTLR